MKNSFIFKIPLTLFIAGLLVLSGYTYLYALDNPQCPLNDTLDTGFTLNPFYTLFLSLIFITTIYPFTEAIPCYNHLFHYCFRAPPQFQLPTIFKIS